MRARSLLVVADDHGTTRATRLRGEVPLVIRTLPDADGGLTAYLVGGAAGPLGGDDLSLTVEVGPGARLRVRSAAASMALPGPHGHRSCARIDVEVGPGADLDWWPEPLVSVVGSDHVVRATVRLHADATMRWVDEVVLGRHGEAGGRLTSRQRVEVGGDVVLDHAMRFGDPHLDGPGGNGPARAVACALLHGALGPARAPVVEAGVRSADLELGPCTRLSVALADDRTRAAAALGTDVRSGRPPLQFP